MALLCRAKALVSIYVATALIQWGVVQRIVTDWISTMRNNPPSTDVDGYVVHRVVVEAQVADLECIYGYVSTMTFERAGVARFPVLTIEKIRTFAENSPVDPGDKGGAVTVLWCDMTWQGTDVMINTVPTQVLVF